MSEESDRTAIRGLQTAEGLQRLNVLDSDELVKEATRVLIYGKSVVGEEQATRILSIITFFMNKEENRKTQEENQKARVENQKAQANAWTLTIIALTLSGIQVLFAVASILWKKG